LALFGVGAGGFINMDLSTVIFFSGCPPTGLAAFNAKIKLIKEKNLNIIWQNLF